MAPKARRSAAPPISALSRRPISIRTALPGPLAKRVIARDAKVTSPSLIHRYPLVVKRASGCMVEDVDGNVFFDAEAGVATVSTGHCHPRIVKAASAQAGKLIHICGTDFNYPSYGELCQLLAGLAPGGGAWKCFLTNSGTEAVEAAIKIARFHTRRSGLIAFRGAFHGRSLGSLSLTQSKQKYRDGFGPFVPGVHHFDFGDAEGIERDRALTLKDIAAIVVEPVLGEGGYIFPPREFLPGLRRICDRHGILLVFDEIQSGMGRTGKWWACEHYGVRPDILTLAKGVASGFPLGAMMARSEIMTWPSGSHGSTYGGNPVCIAAALETLAMLKGGLIDNAARVGAHLKQRLEERLRGCSAVKGVKGLGLMIGVELATQGLAAAVGDLCYQRGLLVLEAGRQTVRLSPPLIITERQADRVAEIFVEVCRDLANDPRLPRAAALEAV